MPGDLGGAGMKVPVIVVEFINAIPTMFGLLFFLALFILMPLSIFRRTRPLGLLGFWITGSLSSALVLIASAVQVFSVWGLPGVIYSALFLGVGLVGAAFAAAVLHGTAADIIGLCLMLALPICSVVVTLLLVDED